MNLAERLTQVSEILIALSGNPIPSQQFQILADYVVMAMPCDYLAVCLMAPEGDGYLVHSLLGMAGGAIQQRLFSQQEGVVGRALSSRRTITVANLGEDEDALADFEMVLHRFGLRAALISPLYQEKQVLGALLFAREEEAGYKPDDVQVAKLLAAGLSSGLEMSRLYQILADERSTLGAVLGSTKDAVLVVNDDGLVLVANPAVQEMFGVEVTAVTGRILSDVIDLPPLLALFAEHEPRVAEIALPDGRTAQASLVQVKTEYGELIGCAAVFRDITVLKELEQMKTDFVNTVSHDLKNPISTINLAAALLVKAGELNESQVQLRDRIVNTADYMDELVSDLLDLGKIEAGLDMHLSPLDLVQLVREVILTLQPTYEQKDQQVDLEMPDSLEIVADKGRLRQVLLNLIGNAVKYTPENGRVQVQVTGQAERVDIAVTDNGIGIPTQDLPYIFDKFYRVQDKETRSIKGTGLGLAIVRSIVEAHNGRITASSTHGKGSTFKVTLPVSATPV